MSEIFTFESWRDTVRPLLAKGRKVESLLWRSSSSSVADLVLEESDISAGQPIRDNLRLSRSLMSLLQYLSCFRQESRWEFMYRLAWRVLYENPRLLADSADPDTANAMSMERAVRRDLHKMHAFVRFREIAAGLSEPSYFAWFEPQHEILRPGASFFVKRFPNMCWTIATPDGSAVWNTEALQFLRPEALGPRPAADGHEDLWRTYYRSICNVARINPSAMQREMPKYYWRNLPEAAEIATLMREGTSRFDARHKEGDHDDFTAAKSLQRSLAGAGTTAQGVQSCRACDLWKHATQAVEGEGPSSARIMLVGEQPGDEEDLHGKPFIGPAGQVLNDALKAAGLTRQHIYITNAVKHFKWEPRGKRRLHKKPSIGEIRACNIWLLQEVETIKPRVIVALGGSALRALSGSASSIEASRAMKMSHPSGARIIATYHPSAILRSDGERAAVLRSALIEDLERAREFSRRND